MAKSCHWLGQLATDLRGGRKCLRWSSLASVKPLSSSLHAKDGRKGSRVYRDRGVGAARDEFTSASVVQENHGARQDHLTHGNDSRLGGSCYLA